MSNVETVKAPTPWFNVHSSGPVASVAINHVAARKFSDWVSQLLGLADNISQIMNVARGGNGEGNSKVFVVPSFIVALSEQLRDFSYEKTIRPIDIRSYGPVTISTTDAAAADFDIEDAVRRIEDEIRLQHDKYYETHPANST